MMWNLYMDCIKFNYDLTNDFKEKYSFWKWFFIWEINYKWFKQITFKKKIAFYYILKILSKVKKIINNYFKISFVSIIIWLAKLSSH